MRKIIPLLFLFIVSCTSIQIPVQEEQSLKLIFEPESNKTTQFYPVEDAGEFLASILNLRNIAKDSIKYAQLELRQIDNKNIQIKSIFKEEVNIAVLRGEFKEKVFRIRTKRQTTGIPPLAWVLKSTSSSLIKNSEGDLVFYQHNGGVIFLTLMPIFGTSNGQNKYIFRSVN
ncbi:hypothetical protein [Adhaeribacter aquaticus]|uniref:hypothetical protein n=1 Tax=Adhaeribacter aquaticus TaxID=299567 RepID=UPI0003F6B246|nr:hypothetical protein [Adhaeribacter aquaticus]